VPSAGNPQSLNRYAYVLNNPLKYTDPSGHCPTCLTSIIGGAVGAMGGAIFYTGQIVYSTVTGNGSATWDYNGYAAAIGTGAIGGALIGTGNLNAVGAGIGVIGNGGYYVVSKTAAGEAVDLKTWAGDSAIGALAGASATGAGPMASAIINGLAGANTYMFNNFMEGKPIKHDEIAITAGVSFLGGLAGAGLAQKAGDVTLQSGIQVLQNVRFGIYESGTLVIPARFARPAAGQIVRNASTDLALWFLTGAGADWLKWLNSSNHGSSQFMWGLPSQETQSQSSECSLGNQDCQ